MAKIKVGITIGDINGIGPEVIIKSLSNEMMLNECTPVIYGSSKVLGYHKNIVQDNGFHFVTTSDATKVSPNKINVINCWSETVDIDLGQPTQSGGQCAHTALDRAVTDLQEGHIDALVTAPINKHAMKLADFPYLGHTEFIAEKVGSLGQELMMLVSDKMKVAVVSTHVPISQVADLVTRERVRACITALEQSLRIDFGIEKPTIGVLGLNPHAGDNGEIGLEDEEIIKPIILELKKKGKLVLGPYSADGFFGKGLHTKCDAILAMYHDQGLIPFKALSFGRGVNFTAGLSVVRTSPDHGTGYDIVGRNIADPTSFREAIYNAIDIVRSRQDFDEMTEDQVDQVIIESEGEIA
ncbi:MAG: 4-hydroxythreonine-4-phosphate dehydrogenase PdxA [Bacteroidota bacterium]